MVGALAGLDLDGEQAVAGVEHEIGLAPRVDAIEMEGRRLRLPRGPAEHLVDNGRLEEGAVGRGLRLGEEAGERGFVRELAGPDYEEGTRACASTSTPPSWGP